jgi:ActR/RegA family two-component response regulator
MPKRVILVEDRAMSAGFLQQTVEEVPGVQVARLVESLAEVQAEVAQKPFPYECAVVDMQIFRDAALGRAAADRPHTDWGIEAVKLLSTVLNKEKILVLTAYSADVRGPLLAIGLDERLFSKPIHPEKLKDLVSAM